MPVEVQNWSDVVLCTQDELESAIGEFAQLVQLDGPSRAKAYLDVIEEGKADIAERLLEFLPDIYANSRISGYPSSLRDLLDSQQYQWERVDEMLDHIAKPETLKDTCKLIATIKQLGKLELACLSSSPSLVEPIQKAIKQRMFEYEAKFERAWRRLKIDLNGDGVITPNERTRTRNTFRRV